ncbi:DNA-directed RNA polymerase II subunit RPB1 [Aphanomyces cochlioides]|nr:DNA-directed RNA polymerase II subunit RPB1 [Aphanomyces cochlioides]
MSDEEEKSQESVDAIIDESLSFLKHVEHNMLTQMRLRGVSNLKKVFMHENPQNQWDEEKGFVMVKEWVLDTDGTNLLDVICFDSVDAKAPSVTILSKFLKFWELKRFAAPC